MLNTKSVIKLGMFLSTICFISSCSLLYTSHQKKAEVRTKRIYNLLTNIRCNDTVFITITSFGCVNNLDLPNCYTITRNSDSYFIECDIDIFKHIVKKTQITSIEFINLIGLMKHSPFQGGIHNKVTFYFSNKKKLKDNTLDLSSVPVDTLNNFFIAN